MSIRRKVFIPRFMDQDAFNAQNLNAKNMLPYFSRSMNVTSVHHTGPIDEGILRGGRSIRLWKGRLYPIHMIIRYLYPYDAIFYPGHRWFNPWGLKLRKLLWRKTPIITTLEGVPWMCSKKREELEKIIGHKIYCMSYEASKYYLQVLDLADHVIAISPFLATIGKHLFGDKFSVIPLGVDMNMFYYSPEVKKYDRVTVVCVGTVYELKRPEIFLELAESLPDTDFKWYGPARGNLIEYLQKEKKRRSITNLKFLGATSQRQLADSYRKADLFVLPSLSEGVPKVAQEASACGLPIVLFGNYQAPTVVHGENGYVVWTDEELFHSVESLVVDREKMGEMGQKSIEMAKEWNWDQVARQWEAELNHILSKA